ncbi:hypothetical protein INT45_006487 [Circinella minor]|uniref:Uncharacterized protein n=1 Tax=Circinella minor TaxID=1195481 RepID=A0A8H7S1H0_9FUNG|nr:hypothetical protein INT45_006487 [Circinella minor]
MPPKRKNTKLLKALTDVTDERLLLQAAIDKSRLKELTGDVLNVEEGVGSRKKDKRKETKREKYYKILYKNEIKDKSMTSQNKKGIVKRRKLHHVEDNNINSVVKKLKLVRDNKSLKDAYQQACKMKPKTRKEETVLRIYNFILQIYIEKPWVLSKEYRNLYSEFDLQVKFWGFVFETWFGENQNIMLHWGDTMSTPCKNMNLRFKFDLRLLVWKEDGPIFDGGTGEVARRATQAKLFSDRLKSVLATKCHLNDFLKAATYLQESEITEIKLPIVQIMGLDAHLCVLRLDGKKAYVLEEVCAFPFPSSLGGIRSGAIENLINGLSNIESLLLNLERVYEESRYCQEDSMERVSRGNKRAKKFSCESWTTGVLLNDDEEEEEEGSEEEGSEEEGSEDEGSEDEGSEDEGSEDEGSEEDEDEENEDENEEDGEKEEEEEEEDKEAHENEEEDKEEEDKEDEDEESEDEETHENEEQEV